MTMKNLSTKILEIQTESGSIYHVVEDRSEWMKVLPGDYEAEPLRTLTGTFYKWSGVIVGEPMWFMGRPLSDVVPRQGVTRLIVGPRIITTTPVMSIREILED
jgi:hypothetical protein